jgi:DNA-binding transcriptional MerR regulator
MSHRFMPPSKDLQYAPGQVLAIGELAQRTGVAITALRYYDELGLVRPATRVRGQRRYDDSAVRQVGVVLFLRDIGFTLDEIARLTAGGSWRSMVKAKLLALERQAADIEAARTALDHALRCPAKDPAACPRFWAIVDERLAPSGAPPSCAARPPPAS